MRMNLAHAPAVTVIIATFSRYLSLCWRALDPALNSVRLACHYRVCVRARVRTSRRLCYYS